MEITSIKNGKTLDLGLMDGDIDKREFKEKVLSKLEVDEAALDFYLVFHGAEEVYVDSLEDDCKIL